MHSRGSSVDRRTSVSVPKTRAAHLANSYFPGAPPENTVEFVREFASLQTHTEAIVLNVKNYTELQVLTAMMIRTCMGVG